MIPDEFEARNRQFIERMRVDEGLLRLTREWFSMVSRYEYSYHFSWLGRPIIQFPSDIVALQEVIWKTRPDLIIETGVARGGSVVFHASMLELLGEDGFVVGVDVDIRTDNRVEIERHPMFKRIRLVHGSSVDDEVVERIRGFARDRRRVMVILDSMHTHAHVLRELHAYSPMVSLGCYLIVLDTIIEDLPAELWEDRPWGPGDNPKTAVREFLSRTDRFEVDTVIDSKLLITVAPGGYLRCIKD